MVLALFLATNVGLYAQVGIGTASPAASAALEIQSITKGLLLPRMTLAQMNAISSPANGLLVYCTDCAPIGFYGYNGSVFRSIDFYRESDSSPTVSSVNFSGTLSSGALLTGSYTYNDLDSDVEGASIFTWYRADDNSGTNQTAIVGATQNTYTLQASDQTQYIAFMVTPVAATGHGPTGTPVLSAYQGPVGLGSTFTTVGANGEAFSTNSTCATQVISATGCSTAELSNGIGTDPDGGGYTVVEIGDSISGYSQCWMAENMQAGNGPSSAWQSNTDNGWYGYYGDGDQTPDNPPSGYNEKEGFIYQWSAAMDGSTTERAQGICPTGWHIPSDCEWMLLENNLGMSISQQGYFQNWRGIDEGTKLKEGGSSNFEGTLTGFRHHTGGQFDFRGIYGNYWSSTSDGPNDAYRRNLKDEEHQLYRGTLPKTYSWPVRCLKD